MPISTKNYVPSIVVFTIDDIRETTKMTIQVSYDNNNPTTWEVPDNILSEWKQLLNTNNPVVAGVVQFGVSIPMIEASAIDDSRQQQISLQNTKRDQENDRHYSVMQRANESEQDWNNRQVKENDRFQAYTLADNLLRDRDTDEILRHQQVLKGFETQRWQKHYTALPMALIQRQ